MSKGQDNMSNTQFFDERSEQSAVKAAIVSKYFWSWAKIIMPRARDGKIAYIDLFAGPGRYKDGAKSTPLLILETAIKDEKMRRMLMTIFNDVDQNNSHTLENEIKSLTGIHLLKYRPQVHNYEVGSTIVQMFKQMEYIPTFLFIDPWGYKGLSLKLINSVLKNWGCDCIFFFNYNRINMGLSNDAVKSHMNALFGERRAEKLRPRLESLRPSQRELTVVEEIVEALKEMGGKYVSLFSFKNDTGSRTTHYLIFVSKNQNAHKIMKDIMAGESSASHQGVASFEYNPVDVRQPSLFELSQPLDDLEKSLLIAFAGRSVTLEQIYEEHNVGKPFITKNYKAALRNLEAQKKITGDIPLGKRRKHNGEISINNVVFSFPLNKE